MVTWLLFAYHITIGNYIFESLRVIFEHIRISCIGWVGWGVSLLFSVLTMLSDVVLGILHWVLVRDEW